MTATLHLLHGYIGCGKTTFAKTLAEDLKCVRFSADEWMIALHGNNPPEATFRENENRVKALIWDVAQNMLQLGHDVIIDAGAWKKSDRHTWRHRAEDLGVGFTLYNITCELETAKKRALKRTADMPSGALFIDENAFDMLRQHFEPLDTDDAPYQTIWTGEGPKPF